MSQLYVAAMKQPNSHTNLNHTTCIQCYLLTLHVTHDCVYCAHQIDLFLHYITMSQLFILFCSRLMYPQTVFSSSPKIFLRTGINTSSPRQKVFNSAYPFSITIPCRLFSQPVLNLYPFLSHSPNTYFSPTNHFLIIFSPISLKKID